MSNTERKNNHEFVMNLKATKQEGSEDAKLSA
jgi:hypothetical protein